MLQLPAGREASRVERAPRYERHRPEQTLLYQLIEEYYFDFAVVLTGIISGILIVVTAGLLGTRSVLTHPPVETLREATA